jgi:aspartyl-tRNA synthetase
LAEKIMLRTHTNGELRITEVGQEVTLCGWVHKSRDKGGMIWVDLRDRYGITQLMLEEGKSSPEALAIARGLGREFVIEAVGVVVERLAKNDKLPTGDIEIKIKNIRILNPAKLRYSHFLQYESWKRSMFIRHLFDTIVMLAIIVIFNIEIIRERWHHPQTV